jgi:hypothetical protein
MPPTGSGPGGVQRVQPATANNATASSTNTGGTSRSADWNADDLQKVVLEYLTKKGFHKAETILRLEASQLQEATVVADVYRKLTDAFLGSASDAYILLRDYVQQSLDLYKGEMARILWPTFAYMFLDLIFEGKDNTGKIEEGLTLGEEANYSDCVF